MNNEIKLSKRGEETIENLKKIIALTSDDLNDEDREENIAFFKKEIEDINFFYRKDREDFMWAVKELHEATDESNFNPFGISEDITKAIKQMKQAEKKMLQAKLLEKTVSRLVHQKLEAMGAEN